MVEVGTIASYAEIIGALIVIGGLGFAMLELRRGREQKRREGAFEMFRNLGSKEFLEGIQILYELPPGLSKAQLEERYGDSFSDVAWVLGQFEDMGTMAYHHLLPLDLTFDFYQPSILNAWRKMRLYIEELRTITENPMLYIYFEWMARRIEDMATERNMDVIAVEMEKWRPIGG